MPPCPKSLRSAQKLPTPRPSLVSPLLTTPNLFFQISSITNMLTTFMPSCGNSHFQISAERIRELDLTWRFALHLEQSWAPYQDGNAARTRDCDIEPIKTVQKFHSSR